MKHSRWIDPSNRKPVEGKEIIESLTLGNNKIPVSKRKSVLSDYFKMIYENLLNGYSVKLPNNFGTMTIFKNKLREGTKPYISPYETIKNRARTLAYNPHTIGYFFSIEIESENMEKYGCKFKAAQKYRRMLSKKLLNGETNFQLKQTCQE